MGALSSEALPGESFGGVYRRLAPGEQIRRAKDRFTAADAILNSTYQMVRAAAGKRATALRDLQRDWLKHRDYMAEHGAPENREASLTYWDTMLDLTAARIEFLSLFNGKDVPKGLTGLYRDGYGGELQLEERGDAVEFSLMVVRGPTFHTGELSGTAKRSKTSGTLRFKEEVEAGDDREPAELTFTLSDGHIVKAEGKNTSYHHGARAYFDGTYYKTREPIKPLPEE